MWPTFRPSVSACSFQEGTLRASKQALLNSYNKHIGGIDGRGIGFEEYDDDRGRRCMKHSFVNMSGYHEIKGLENQVLVLLFMAWFIADQYGFFSRDIVETSRPGFDRLAVTVISDKLSGDDDSRTHNEQNLRRLVDPNDESVPIVLTRSPTSDVFPGDLLVDNLVGWLNAAIAEPTAEFGLAARGESPASHRGRRCARLARRDDREYREYLREEQRSQTGCSAGRMQSDFHHGLLAARSIASSGVWGGWHVLAPSSERLESTAAMFRLENGETV